ncbi:hypothetical protein BDA99DRAFT_308734 [Phascolomyces articulosus]|uniref:F-box domain-containing protein n=1 Tax=Phascolomyces articulosus TaxID=60185 RepID=A0AAD5K6Z7_9FUNG|nr:hypothetical protein BDA99DRAFT_308734 [Phascolomyces articulosus]
MTTFYQKTKDLLFKIQHGTLVKDRQDFLLFMPYDIIAAIFSLLNSHELVVCVSVCRRWRTFFIENPHIQWKTVLFHNIQAFFKCPIFSSEIPEENKKARYIRSLSLDHSVIHGSYQNIKEIEMADMLKQLIKINCSSLDHLEFHDCPLSCMEFLQYMQFTGERLRRMEIGNSYIDPRLVGIILHACPNLISLECTDCTPYVSSMVSKQPVPIDMPSFQHLVMMQIVVDESTGPDYLGQVLRQCPQLKSLTLNSQVDWIVRDAIDRPPPEIIFDAIYDTVQQSCKKLESFTFSCLPYWTVTEHAHITHGSPASLQDLYILSKQYVEEGSVQRGDIFRNKYNRQQKQKDIMVQGLKISSYGTQDKKKKEDEMIVKRKYATLEYYVGCPPPRMKNSSWTMLSISVDTDIARVGYRFFPFTLGSVRKFLSDRPNLTMVELSGISGKYNYRPSELLIPAVTDIASLRHLVLQDSDMHTIASILSKHKCPTVTHLTIRNSQWVADRYWLDDLSKVQSLRVLFIDNYPEFDALNLGLLFQNTMCLLEQVHFVRLNLQDHEQVSSAVMNSDCTISTIQAPRNHADDEKINAWMMNHKLQEHQVSSMASMVKHWIIGLSVLERLKCVKLVHCSHVTSKDILDLVERAKEMKELHIIGCDSVGNVDYTERLLCERNGRLIVMD